MDIMLGFYHTCALFAPAMHLAQGLIPDEQEAMELQRMSEQLLNAVPEANDPNVTDPNQTIGIWVFVHCG